MSTHNDTKMGDITSAIGDFEVPSSLPRHEAYASTREDLERRLVKKLDLRMSIIVVIYTLNYIDRTNISNARLQGFEQDLHLQGQQYATVLSILFVGYTTMQVPANMFLYWLGRPSIFLPSCMLVWGAISALTGTTTNFTGAVLARFFLGFAEGPFYPGSLFLVSQWYKRDELALRVTVVSCGIPISNAFGSLIASGILQTMQGKLGHAAWRWLFFIEGGITMFVAICALFILPDFPHNTKWLTPEERELAVSRLVEDGQGRAGVRERTSMQGLWDALSDGKVWAFVAAYIAQLLGQSFFAYFPTLSATMGYNTTVTLLLCAPPWVLSTIGSFALSRYSDKKKKRYIYFAASNAVTVLGFVISMCTMNTAARYLSLFLMAQVNAGYMVFWSWVNNTFTGEPAKRAVAVALVNSLAQAGNIAGSYVWQSHWGPTYRYSYAVCIAAIGVSTGIGGGMYMYLKRLNEQNAWKQDGDDNESFKYLV
ncbi:MFS general substrate transporter [Suillus clintonianus]|uniref:MFS general substrate transporter n=1 Tax=Suillus clintonianus TaxID=1904413 RepID=UPI001B87C88B|nr:MFS general substrate transporter [Suillus clintonianus]KAG2113222.1 MFS general substrate transporter [Suillus clintonianus]